MFHTAAMDFASAIEINRLALARIVAALFAMAGLAGGATVERLPGAVRRAALRILRPAESAVRRLIVIAAHGLVVTPAASRPFPAGLKIAAKGSGGSRAAAFQLYDARKRFNLSGRRRGKSGPPPRITCVDFDPRIPLFRAAPAPAAPARPAPESPSGGTVSALGLARRLAAITLALADLPKQARRLVRWRARRLAVPQAKFRDPLRPGAPPGHRKRPGHEIDEILRDCHERARDLPPPNSS